MARKKLGELLVESGIISDASLRTALGEQRRWGGTLGRTLIDMKAITEEDLVATLSRQLNLQAVDIDRMQIPQQVIDLVPGDLAQQWSIVPFAQPMKFLDVAMSDPTNLGIIDELRIRTQLNIRSYLAGPKAIERAIQRYYRRGFDAFSRNEASIPVEGGDYLDADPSVAVARTAIAAGAAAVSRDGIRPFPRGASSNTITPPIATSPAERDAEIGALQVRLSQLEALVARDEDVLRKLLALLIDKGVASRDEIMDRIR